MHIISKLRHKYIFKRLKSIDNKGSDSIKKKTILLSIIVLVLLFPTIRNVFNKVMMPDKILVVGHQISEYAFEFTKEIKDPDKIAEFEDLFEEIVFTTEEWKEEAYADIILQINHKKGTYTHPLRIYIGKNGDSALTIISGLSENNIGKLSKSQLEKLKTIID